MWNIGEANVCSMKQQPDPNRNLLMRWVLPYEKKTLCSCTKIQLQYASKCTSTYHISMPKALDYFYTDEPLLLVNTVSQKSLQVLLGCTKGIGRLNVFSYTISITLIIVTETLHWR